MGAGLMNARGGPLVEVGVAEWGLEDESGDTVAVEPFSDGVLLAVVDGIGHGPEAAAAASTALQVLVAHPSAHPAELFTACHDALKETRGAVMSLASIKQGTMIWAGVGNVGGVLLTSQGRSPARVLASRGGVLGQLLPRLYATEVSVQAGDTLILATDGVAHQSLQLLNHLAPQANADRILATARTGNDDALVLVARYRGAAG
ncbi:MAG: serine/threonine-protein phosphatase [Actinomycetota bacterium]|nr:serine/threonine-protein phosphatase [Actinomycetota bacterium]